MIVLQIYFKVKESNLEAFDKLYDLYYAPALRKQKGYTGSKLLKLFPPELASEFDASPSDYNLEIELVFDTELNRRLWASSEEHKVVWEMAEALFEEARWLGYDVLIQDNI